MRWRGAGRAALPVIAVVALVGPLGTVGPASAASTSTTPPAASVTTSGAARPGSTTTSAPARCEPVPPTAMRFVGTALAVDESSVRFRIDEVRAGPPVGGTQVDVTFVRDARFFRVGTRYLVSAAQDPESGAFVSKVRILRGTDPRCVAVDPIVTSLANGTAIDTGTFTGLRGTSGKVLRAVLLPLGGAVGLLAALVAVKWLVILTGRGVRRLVRGPVVRP